MSKFYLFKKPDYRECLTMALGVMIGIGGVAWLSHITDNVYIMAPFGASAVLLYCAKTSPLAQPRNFLCSHFIAAFIAVSMVRLLGNGWYVAPLAVALAIFVMMLTDTVHPPGGATALLVVLQGTTDYLFLLQPIAVGVVIMYLGAVISTKLIPGATQYPVRK